MNAKAHAAAVRTPLPFKRLLLGGASAPEPRARESSYIGLRPLRTEEEIRNEALRFLDELGDDLLTFSINIDALERSLGWVPYEPSARAAGAAVSARLEELRGLRDELTELQLVLAHPVALPLLDLDGPLADYLRGIAAWCTAALRALEQVVYELTHLRADWGTFRRRIDDAEAFFVHELQRSVRDELARRRGEAPEEGPVLVTIAGKLESLFAAAEWLDQGLSQPFG